MKSMLKNYLIKILIVLCVVALDLVTKSLFYGTNTSVIPSLFGFRPTTLNTGGAWSFMSDKMWLLIVLTFVFLVFIVVFEAVFKCKNKLYTISIAFIVGGTIGNLCDRLFIGGVRDFIFFEFFVSYPTFNFADVFLCLGMIMMFVFIIFVYKPQKK